MSIGADVLTSLPVVSLRDMYMAEYADQASASSDGAAPAMLNAVGACAGFAAQIAVWRELILPGNRNPGDFLCFPTTQAGDNFIFGEAINQFLVSVGKDRLSFLSFAAATLRNQSQLPDFSELFGHVAQSIGSPRFGRPRVPPGIELPELPRIALDRTWAKAAQILNDCRAAEWPALLGAAARVIMFANLKLAPTGAVKILLEAAVPMSKLNPATVESSGIPAPVFANWSMRALRPENNQQIVAEVRAAMPAPPPPRVVQRAVITRPKIAFLNLAGARCAKIAAEDAAAVGAFFDGCDESTSAPVPACDVLFLYCDLDSSGKVLGPQRPVREVVRDSTAKIAVIASQVPAEFMADRQFQTALAKGDNPPVNLVITLNRNGTNFARFFKSLFQIMWTGKTMPMAWVQLAPQGPLPPPDNVPGTIVLMEAGQVSFATGALSKQ